MENLQILRDLQATLDNLKTIERDLSAFPPDLADVDVQLKGLSKQITEREKAEKDALVKLEKLKVELVDAQKREDFARAQVKTARTQTEYGERLRELGGAERERADADRPLKQLETQLAANSQQLEEFRAKHQILEAQFQELHLVFLSEHENQVVVRTELNIKKTSLEAGLPPADRARFERIVSQRQGRAVVPVENGACTGCRTKLRGPLMAELREKGTLACEGCQRILYLG
jgi:uncharacterized protein